jgi:hypothetical protein
VDVRTDTRTTASGTFSPGYEVGIGRALNNIGSNEYRLGDDQEAIKLELARESMKKGSMI